MDCAICCESWLPKRPSDTSDPNNSSSNSNNVNTDPGYGQAPCSSNVAGNGDGSQSPGCTDMIGKFTGIAGSRTRSDSSGLDAWSQQPVTLICGHIFHRGCVVTWLDMKQTCPTCRTKQGRKEPIAIYLNLDYSKLARRSLDGSESSIDIYNLTGQDTNKFDKEKIIYFRQQLEKARSEMWELQDKIKSMTEDLKEKEKEQQKYKERCKLIDNVRKGLVQHIEKEKAKYAEKRNELQKERKLVNAANAENERLVKENSELKLKLKQIDQLKARVEQVSVANNKLIKKLKTEHKKYSQLRSLYLMLTKSQGFVNGQESPNSLRVEKGTPNIKGLDTTPTTTAAAATATTHSSEMDVDEETDLDDVEDVDLIDLHDRLFVNQPQGAQVSTTSTQAPTRKTTNIPLSLLDRPNESNAPPYSMTNGQYHHPISTRSNLKSTNNSFGHKAFSRSQSKSPEKGTTNTSFPVGTPNNYTNPPNKVPASTTLTQTPQQSSSSPTTVINNPFFSLRQSIQIETPSPSQYKRNQSKLQRPHRTTSRPTVPNPLKYAIDLDKKMDNSKVKKKPDHQYVSDGMGGSRRLSLQYTGPSQPRLDWGIRKTNTLNRRPKNP